MQPDHSSNPVKKWVPTRKIAEHNGVSVRTVERWQGAGIIQEPKYVNGRKYWPEGTEPA